MWQANRGCNPQAQQEPTQWSGKIPARHTTNPTGITIKGHLTWTPVLAQAGDHRFQCRLFVEIVSGLGPQGDRGSCVTEIADFDDRLAFALRALLRRDGATILAIHLDLFHWRSEFAWVGQLFGTRQQTARGVQDFPDRSTGAGQRDLCCLQLRVTRKGRGPGTRFKCSGGARRISTIRWVTRISQRK